LDTSSAAREKWASSMNFWSSVSLHFGRRIASASSWVGAGSNVVKRSTSASAASISTAKGELRIGQHPAQLLAAVGPDHRGDGAGCQRGADRLHMRVAEDQQVYPDIGVKDYPG
jgi:hypothetical protein